MCFCGKALDSRYSFWESNSVMTEYSSGLRASDNLFKLLLKTALISSAFIIIVAGYGVTLLYNHHLIEDAERDAISVGKAILALEKHQLIIPDSQNNERVSITADDFDQLDATMQKGLAPFNILKIKVFSEQGVVVYSTDHQIIGKKDFENPRLQIALAGGLSSNRQMKGEIADLNGETQLDVDVVETYIPIFSSHDEVIGSFEIYQDVSSSHVKSQEGMAKSLMTLSVVLIVVFGLSLYIIRIAAKDLNSAHGKLHKMATEDALAGVWNRSAIIKSVQKQVLYNQEMSATGTNGPASLIMIDVDKFKSINDRYGHPVGDQALQAIAQCISNTLRYDDLMGRYGGEEFLALLPDTDQSSAKSLANRIRQNIEEIDFQYQGERIFMTASLGVITLNNSHIDYDQALKLADEALYQAKHEGRNRVCIAESASESLIKV